MGPVGPGSLHGVGSCRDLCDPMNDSGVCVSTLFELAAVCAWLFITGPGGSPLSGPRRCH